MFKYFKLQIKLIRPMLATNPEASIYEAHVLQKAKKQIQEANKLTKKIAKSLEKYRGVEITPGKEIAELQGIIRAYQQQLGKALEIPETVEELLDLSRELDVEFQEAIASGDQQRATVFMRDTDGWPMISNHMVLGMCKEITKICVNNGEDILSSKVKVCETLSLDIKAVEQFSRASMDICRDANGERELMVRPIVFEQMGKRKTAIAMSEQLPVGTEFCMTLRVRESSPFAKQDVLENILDYGKNLGLGSWRGSGNMGAFRFKLDELDIEETADEDGWR